MPAAEMVFYNFSDDRPKLLILRQNGKKEPLNMKIQNEIFRVIS